MNRLAQSSSPYLLQHAQNPVDWYPWGDEAWQRAKSEDKPVLLSVGYSACHWCHVMAHESFEDARVAALMNERFINIKVDREERPDVDQVYQGVVQLLGRGGGWPLTVFLTPDKKPFFGGTYFPPADRYGMPGFSRLLTSLSESWKKQRGELDAQAEEFVDGLQQLAAHGLDAPRSALVEKDVAEAGALLARAIDRREGGFGQQGPKFPNPMNLALMLRGHARGGGQALYDGVTLTLEKMAKGGLYDQLGGGFHRYSVDGTWSVPHFEKMLYDNAQLLHLYAEAWQLEQRPLWKKTVEETVDYLAREMTAPDGAFYAAQDADSEGEEGKFFVWTPSELTAVLGASDAQLVAEHFGVRPAGNFEHGATVLFVSKPIDELGAGAAERLAAAKQKLFAERKKRIAPSRDDKVLAGWNGLTIRGLAFGGRVFGRDEWIAMARRAADALLTRYWSGGVLTRTPGFGGVLEDYGGVAAGLVALYQACFDPKYLEVARALADAAHEKFFDAEKGVYLTAPKGTADLLVQSPALHDNAVPSGASMLCEAQVALAALTQEARHLERATAYLERIAGDLKQNPFAYGHLWLAADAMLAGAPEVTIVGDAERARPMLEAIRGKYLPTVSVRWFTALDAAPAWLATSLEGRKPLAGRATAWVCRKFVCQAPVGSAQDLLATL
jgi:uncharacterized protein